MLVEYNMFLAVDEQIKIEFIVILIYFKNVLSFKIIVLFLKTVFKWFLFSSNSAKVMFVFKFPKIYFHQLYILWNKQIIVANTKYGLYI